MKKYSGKSESAESDPLLEQKSTSSDIYLDKNNSRKKKPLMKQYKCFAKLRRNNVNGIDQSDPKTDTQLKIVFL